MLLSYVADAPELGRRWREVRSAMLYPPGEQKNGNKSLYMFQSKEWLVIDLSSVTVKKGSGFHLKIVAQALLTPTEQLRKLALFSLYVPCPENHTVMFVELQHLRIVSCISFCKLGSPPPRRIQEIFSCFQMN